MNCIEFRQLKLADPYSPGEEASQHKSTCARCAAFEREIHDLDDSVREALTIAVPEGFAAKVLLNQSLQSQPRRPTRWFWLSMAASLFIAVFLFQLYPAEALDNDIILHLDHEAHGVHGKSGDITLADVKTVLFAVGGSIDDSLGLGKVTYASECYIGDKLVAHFVVENGGDPYTLIIVPTQRERQLVFQSERWYGVITPHATGSLALIATARTESATKVKSLAKHYGEAIKQLPI